MLDPNQGVTGKGLLRLQEAGIDVALFPHALFKQIRAINAPFIRSQQALGATIVTPTQDQELRTYETEGRVTVRFKSLNHRALVHSCSCTARDYVGLRAVLFVTPEIVDPEFLCEPVPGPRGRESGGNLKDHFQLDRHIERRAVHSEHQA